MKFVSMVCLAYRLAVFRDPLYTAFNMSQILTTKNVWFCHSDCRNRNSFPDRIIPHRSTSLQRLSRFSRRAASRTTPDNHTRGYPILHKNVLTSRTLFSIEIQSINRSQTRHSTIGMRCLRDRGGQPNVNIKHS